MTWQHTEHSCTVDAQDCATESSQEAMLVIIFNINIIIVIVVAINNSNT
jgi:hypothetical protein